jgi:hypothetical protein
LIRFADKKPTRKQRKQHEWARVSIRFPDKKPTRKKRKQQEFDKTKGEETTTTTTRELQKLSEKTVPRYHQMSKSFDNITRERRQGRRS